MTQNTAPVIKMVNPFDPATKAEIIWCLKCVASHFSAKSCDGIKAVFAAMFPGIPETFSLGRTKSTYILTHALGPYFREQMVSDMDIPYYSLQYDETTNHENVKELQVLIKFWSKSESRVVVCHLETFFLGKATAEVLREKIKAAVNNINLSLSHIVMLASDGPNVNKAVFRSLSNEVLLI